MSALVDVAVWYIRWFCLHCCKGSYQEYCSWQCGVCWRYYSAPVGVRSIVINLSVCPWTYLWNCWIDWHKILCARSRVAMPRSSSSSVVLRYVLPDLWMTSRLAVMGHMELRGWPDQLLAVSYMCDQNGVWCLWMLVVVARSPMVCCPTQTRVHLPAHGELCPLHLSVQPHHHCRRQCPAAPSLCHVIASCDLSRHTVTLANSTMLSHHTAVVVRRVTLHTANLIILPRLPTTWLLALPRLQPLSSIVASSTTLQALLPLPVLLGQPPVQIQPLRLAALCVVIDTRRLTPTNGDHDIASSTSTIQQALTPLLIVLPLLLLVVVPVVVVLLLDLGILTSLTHRCDDIVYLIYANHI